MKNLVLIAAIGRNYELGKDNSLIWKFKGDMKFFREHTIGKTIVMGRKTFESLPRLLPERKHIVLTHQNLEIPGVIVIHSKEELFTYLQGSFEEVMVIGGASIYEMFIEDATKMLLTEINDVCVSADAYFPRFDKDYWNSELLGEKEEKGISYKHICYTKKLVKEKRKR